MKNVKSREGSSILLVLASMMVLMIIGTSALVAAGSNLGAGESRRVSDQLNMYADGIQKSVKHSLEMGEADKEELDDAKNLAGQILKKVYDGYAGTPVSSFALNLTPSLHGVDLSGVEVKVFIDASVGLTEFEPYEPEITIYDDSGDPLYVIPAVPRVHQSASINASITVTVRAETEIAGEPHAVLSSATYNLMGAYLEDDSEDEDTEVGVMLIKDAGDLELISHEKVDL